MRTVLIVDDDQNICQIIEEFLSQMGGFDVVKVYNGQEALNTLKEQSFDLVVTDIVMPDLDGIDLISHIVSEYPQTKILACSGSGDKKLSKGTVATIALEQAQASGAVNTIMKPIGQAEFTAKINEIFGGKT